jgi:hypothetical protein
MQPTLRRRLAGVVLAAAVAVPGVACAASPGTVAPGRAGYSKVMVIAEENRTYAEVIGSPDAPYLTRLARDHGSATRMSANYPVGCPSLAAYILMTSGSTGGICDDLGPRHHRLREDNIFAQLDAAHRPWRNYAEDLPAPCAGRNSADGVFLVRHTPVPYYTSEARACAAGQIDLGTPAHGALRDDVRAGRLPSYSFVTPDTCHDMHGAPSCPAGRVRNGDRWLAAWIPQILAGADYRAGRLVVIITWDEGSSTDNHIPTVVLSPTTRAIVAPAAYDHCSTLRTTEDVLGLAPLRCARTARSMTAAFHL